MGFDHQTFQAVASRYTDYINFIHPIFFLYFSISRIILEDIMYFITEMFYCNHPEYGSCDQNMYARSLT
jgi:hypothetical protein